MQWTRKGVDFICDERKRQLNLRKHGVDLLDASTAFFDPLCMSFFDAEHSETEDRYQLLAKTVNEKLLFIVYTIRNNRVRLVSARKVTKKKREPMSSNSETFVLKDGRVMEGATDWERLDAMTDEEVTAAALSDPDAPPLADEQLQRFRRLPEVPGGTFLDRIRAQTEENRQSVTIRCDADVLAFYRSQGKGYQRLMNNVLRAYMESQRPGPRARAMIGAVQRLSAFFTCPTGIF